jgi:hypothetical protein
LSELRRAAAKSVLYTDAQGRRLPDDVVEKINRVRAVRILSYVLTVLRESDGKLDEAVSYWMLGWADTFDHFHRNWKRVPIGKPLQDALAWVPDAAALRVLSARWLAVQAKSYPALNSPFRISNYDKSKLPKEVFIGPANFGVLTKLSVNGKIVIDRSEDEAVRIHDTFAGTKLGRRAANLEPRRNTTNRYRFSDLLGGVSRRMASYWWKQRGTVNLWGRFEHDVDEVFRSWSVPLTRHCDACGREIVGKPVEEVFCSEKCADKQDLRDRTPDVDDSRFS